MKINSNICFVFICIFVLSLLKQTIVLDATEKKESLAAPFYWAPFILIGTPH